MGHYEGAREHYENELRDERERRAHSTYEHLRSVGRLTDDKIKDAIVYLLRESTSFGNLKTEADVHIRRLEGQPGFED